jgi:hypothetical protein
MYKYKFSSWDAAEQALKLARRIIPNSHWYLTNEYGGWWIVES